MRKDIVARGVLSNHDFERARRILAKAGVLQNVYRSGYILRIHALGGPPEACLREDGPAPTTLDRFDPLLAAWKIEPLKALLGTSSRINRRFFQDEDGPAFQQEPAASARVVETMS